MSAVVARVAAASAERGLHGHRIDAPFDDVRHAANAVAPHWPGAAVGTPNAIAAIGGVPGAAPSARPRAFSWTRSVPGVLVAFTAIAKACQGPDKALGTADGFTPAAIGVLAQLLRRRGAVVRAHRWRPCRI